MKRSLSDRELKRLEAILAGTKTRAGQAEELARHFNIPVPAMVRLVGDYRGRVAQ